MFLVNETDKWSFKLNPPIGGLKQLGTKKKIAIRTEAEMKLARKLTKRHGKRLAIKRLEEIESKKEVINNSEVKDTATAIPPKVKETEAPVEEVAKDIPTIEVPKKQEEEKIVPNDAETQEKEVEPFLEDEKTQEATVIDVTSEVIEPSEEEPEEEDEDAGDPEDDDDYEEEIKDTLSINVGDFCVTDVSGKEVDVEIIDMNIEEDGSISYKGVNQNTGRVVTIRPEKKKIFRKKEESNQRLSLSECE